MKPQNSTRKRLVIRLIVVAMLLAGVVGAVCIYLGISSSLHAEQTLHAITLATVVVDHYVQQERRWPKSWAELHKVVSVEAPSMYSWPADAETIQQFVSIDFHANLSDVASQSGEQFNAINPRGAYYPYKDRWYVKALIDTVKRTVLLDRNQSN